MSSSAPSYYVHGVELVGVDSLCEACEQRPAVGRSVNGHAICKRCAGWAAREAAELAAEVEASKQRTAQRSSDALTRVRRLTARIAQPSPREAARLRRAGQAGGENDRAASLTHFQCGHERTNANTYRNRQGRRFCRQCRRNHNRASKARRRATA